jgi:hypothetical protein
MTARFGEVPSRELLSAREQTMLDMVAPIGASGAVGTLVKSAADLGLVRGATGTYAMTFPPSPGNVFIGVMCKSSTGAVSQAYLSALDAAAGTASFVLLGPTGAATDPASGDALYISVRGDVRAS